LFDSKINETLNEEIEHYDRAKVEPMNAYDHIPAGLVMKCFLVLKEKLEAIRANWRGKFLIQNFEKESNRICFN